MSVKKVNPNFIYLWDKIKTDRFILLQGGTRSGKTYSTIHFIIDFCLQYSGTEIDICRLHYNALQATVMRDFFEILKSYNLYDDKYHNKTNKTYLLNGNLISYYGADEPKKVYGRKRHILWLNEAQQFTNEIIDQMFPRTEHRIILDYNPAISEGHYLMDLIARYPPLITTYKDNPFLSEGQIEEIESRKNNKYWWDVFGQGVIGRREGLVFQNWTLGDMPTDIQYIYGQDYGYAQDPTTLIRVGIDRKNRVIYADECFYLEQGKLSTREIFDITKANLTNPNDLIIGDAHGQQARIIDDLQRLGLNIQPCLNYPIAPSLLAMQDYMIVVSDRSNNLKKELSNYSWANDKAGVAIDAFNHAIDPIRYVFDYFQSYMATNKGFSSFSTRTKAKNEIIRKNYGLKIR